MKRRTLALLLAFVVIGLTASTSHIAAQSNSYGSAGESESLALGPRADEYSLTWYVVGGGGYMTSGDGMYQLGATAGQPAVAALSNGDYSLQAGFWGDALNTLRLYLPLILK